MLNQELRSDFGEEVQGGEASHQAVGSIGLFGVGLFHSGLVHPQDGLHQTVDNLLTSQNELRRSLCVLLGGVVLVLFGPEHGLQQLLEPLEPSVLASDDHVGNVPTPGQQKFLQKKTH